MNRLTLEQHQVWIYLAAIAIGLLLGNMWPMVAPGFEAALWPVLALLLYATFVQVPLLHLRDAFADLRFIAAVLVGNFVFIPLLAWAMVQALPHDAPLRLGVLLVLLVPCTDWFITFCQLGRGNAARAIAVTPVNLILQLLLLPLYLWLMSGSVGDVAGAGLLAAFTPAAVAPAMAVVLVPLGAAALSERWIEARPGRAVWRDGMAWAPVPLLACVVLLIAGAQAGAVGAVLTQLWVVVPLFVAFLVAAWLLAEGLARGLRLPSDQGRTLAFSLGTRNSFVVLPLALALPAGWEATAMVVVLQSLVELFGMLGYLWWVPRRFGCYPAVAGAAR